MNKNQIIITWNGHSCFTVSTGGYSIVLDPYAPDSVPGLPALSLTGDQVLCSHEHGDHGYREAVQISSASRKIPMHYRSDAFGYPVIDRLERYTELCKDVVVYDSNVMAVDGDTRPQTAVLQLV